MEKIYILDIPVSVVDKQQAKQNIINWMNEDKARTVFTPNPEMIMAALKDEKLKKAMYKADMIVPDGIGVVWASKYASQRITERVAGCDLIQEVMKEMAGTDKRVYFLGGAPTVAEKAAQKMKEKYKGLKVAGVHDGYFNEEQEKKLIEEIFSLKPDLLLVGLGVPKQEKWIYANRDKLGFKVAVGVGGSFDVLSGNVKRAPQIFRKLNLEWFYRLITQPTRFKRMLELPKFALKVKKEYKNSKKNKSKI